MERTITITLCEVRFQITEGGYKLLSDYLCDIESRVSTSPNSREVMRGVERRVVEIFKLRNPFNISAVDITMVREAIDRIGDSSKFGEKSSNYCSSQPYLGSDRRLMRDGASGVFGGVCAGIAAYYNLDLTFVRIAALALMLFGGVSVIVYIVLWAVLPMAVSPAEIEMLHRNNFRRPRQ